MVRYNWIDPGFYSCNQYIIITVHTVQVYISWLNYSRVCEDTVYGHGGEGMRVMYGGNNG